MNLCDENEIKALLERHGFRFSMSMGQNFLIDDALPEKIAASAVGGPEIGVLEIGPGIGALTRALSARAGRVAAVELDRKLLPILAQTLADRDNVEIVPGDILKIDLSALAADKLPGLIPIVCANLPYKITTPVLTALLEAKCFQSITVMLQREAALRVCASPGDEGYGFLSVFCQFYADAQILFHVPPSSFLPAPKVTSSVLRLVPKPPAHQAQEEKQVLRLAKAAFVQRRKTLVNSLSGALSPAVSREELVRALSACGFDANVRGERLSPADFTRLSKNLRERR